MERANPALWQAARDLAQRLGLRAFWQWWTAELAQVMPAGPRNALRRRRLRPVLALGADEAVLWVPAITGGELAFRESARIPLAGDPAEVARAGRAAIDALPRVAYGGAVSEPKVVVALQPSQVLRKTISLPAAAEESLENVLAFDVDRHTPFKADEVCFDATVVGRDPAKKEIRVDWVAALRTVVDQARRRAESWGAVVVGVTPESPTDPAALRGTKLDLLPAEERGEARTWRRVGIALPLVLIAAVALVAIALPLWQKRGYTIALMQTANQARLQADASNALREQLEQATGDYNFALQRKYAFPAVVQVVDDVTKLLPDDTWLTQLEVRTTARGKDPRRDLTLRGESGNAGRLVSLLEESKIFEQAAPRSPTTKIQPGSGEIFDLGAQLKPLTPPQPVEVASLAGSESGVAPATGTPAATPPPGTAAPAAGSATPSATAAVAAPSVPAAKPAEAPAALTTSNGAAPTPGPAQPARPALAAPAAAPAAAPPEPVAGASGPQAARSPFAGSTAPGAPRARVLPGPPMPAPPPPTPGSAASTEPPDDY